MNRQQRFGLLLSPLEKRLLKRLAESEGGLSQAATLRRLIRGAAIERGLWPPKQQGEEVEQ
jgi:hypothetical protein